MKNINGKKRSRKVRIGIIGAGILAAAITLGVAAPSMAAETTTTATSTSQSESTDSMFTKTVKMDLTNDSGSSVKLHHRSSNQQTSTHTTLDAGASSTNNTKYTFSNSGESIEVNVNGHTVKVTYNDGDSKQFTVTVS